MKKFIKKAIRSEELVNLMNLVDQITRWKVLDGTDFKIWDDGCVIMEYIRDSLLDKIKEI